MSAQLLARHAITLTNHTCKLSDVDLLSAITVQYLLCWYIQGLCVAAKAAGTKDMISNCQFGLVAFAR